MSHFTHVSEIDIHPNLIVSVEGQSGAGKSDFGLGGREPVYYFRIDTASNQTLYAAKEAGRDIRVADFKLDISDTYNEQVLEDPKSGESQRLQEQMRTHATGVWESVVEAVEEAVSEAAGTIVLETVSDVFDILKFARYGRLNKVPQIAYPKFYAEMRNLINKVALSPSGTSLVMNYPLKPVYRKVQSQNNGPETVFKTEVMERKGFDDIEYLAHAMVRVYREGGLTDPNRVNDRSADGYVAPKETSSFALRVLKCNAKASLVGEDIMIPDRFMGFNILGEHIYEERWEA